MERIKIDKKDYIIGYHTQEFRATTDPLDNPILCTGDESWLGVGYYFWTELEYAHYWGEDFKSRATGYYDIYSANICVENCINTVFSEEGYLFFYDCIEKAINHIEGLGRRLTLHQVNKYLSREIWPKLNIEGIIYDDKPKNPQKKDRIYSAVPELYYKKRIQIVAFTLDIVRNFAILHEEQSPDT